MRFEFCFEFCFEFDFCFLSFVWNLEFGIWNLEFGIWNFHRLCRNPTKFSSVSSIPSFFRSRVRATLMLFILW